MATRGVPSAPAMLLAILLASASWAAPSATAQTAATGTHLSVEAPQSLGNERDAPRPKRTPEGTVQELFADRTFFRMRNSVPSPMVQRFRRCFTPDLVKYIEAHNRDVDRWIQTHKNEPLKLPVPGGPIFFSNYEGANSFRVGRAKTDDDSAEVPVSFSYTNGRNTARWVDVVLLRRAGAVWLMDDIRFDPARWDNYTLRKRLALTE